MLVKNQDLPVQIHGRYVVHGIGYHAVVEIHDKCVLMGTTGHFSD